jgi:hypothetical protein
MAIFYALFQQYGLIREIPVSADNKQGALQAICKEFPLIGRVMITEVC